MFLLSSLKWSLTLPFPLSDCKLPVQPPVKRKHTHTTFILKNVMLVSRSTVDFRSWRRSGFPAGKLSWNKTEENNMRSQNFVLVASHLVTSHSCKTTSHRLGHNMKMDYQEIPSNQNKMKVCLIV